MQIRPTLDFTSTDKESKYFSHEKVDVHLAPRS